MSRTVVLTGATGFIGGALAGGLTAGNWHVRALVRPKSLAKRPIEAPIEWVEGSLEDTHVLSRLTHEAYAIVHCAGAVRGASRADFDSVNVGGVARLVAAASAQNTCPHFLLLSSVAAREPHLSYYAASKQKGEEVLEEHAGCMPWTVLRPPAVYGPGDRELLPLFRLMTRGIAPILGDRRARLSLLYVEDLVRAVMRWLDVGGCSNGKYELHDGHLGGYTWDEVLDTAGRVLSKRVRRLVVPSAVLRVLASVNTGASRIGRWTPMFTQGKIRELRHCNWVCDNAALTAAIGWVPSVSLEEGIKRTFAHDRELAVSGHT